jgi:cytosine/adenosine deaminase-related metal-dependent hydrolase
MAELLLGGCTTTSDHMYLFPQDRDVKLEAVFEAAEALGIRIHACRGSMSVGQSGGGLPPDECTQREEEILADSVRVIKAFHDPRPMAMRRIDLAPCAPFLVTPELLEQSRTLAAEHKVLLHTHAAETLDEERYCLERFGVRPLEWLHQRGWLGPNVYLAHCVHVNEHEIGLLAETGTGVSHCPCSNMRLGSGIAPIRRMLDAGVKVGLAVDGSSSNDGGNLLVETRQCLLLQRVAHGPAAFTATEAFQLATIGGAGVLHRPELGRLEAGCAADMVIYDALDVAFAGGIAQDPLGAIILCHAPRPDRVIIAGKTVVDGGQVVAVDWPQTIADFNTLVREKFREL